MEAALAPQRCWMSWGGAGQAALVGTGNSTSPEGLAAAPSACKPWMRPKPADDSKHRAHSAHKKPDTNQCLGCDLAMSGCGDTCSRTPESMGTSPHSGHPPAAPCAAAVPAASPAAPSRQGKGNRLRAGAAAAKDFAGEAAARRGAAAFPQSPWRPPRNHAPPGSTAQCRWGRPGQDPPTGTSGRFAAALLPPRSAEKQREEQAHLGSYS